MRTTGSSSSDQRWQAGLRRRRIRCGMHWSRRTRFAEEVSVRAETVLHKPHRPSRDGHSRECQSRLSRHPRRAQNGRLPQTVSIRANSNQLPRWRRCCRAPCDGRSNTRAASGPACGCHSQRWTIWWAHSRTGSRRRYSSRGHRRSLGTSRPSPPTPRRIATADRRNAVASRRGRRTRRRQALDPASPCGTRPFSAVGKADRRRCRIRVPAPDTEHGGKWVMTA